MTPHRPLPHCWQPLLTQVSAKRNRFSGERPSRASLTKKSSTCRRCSRKATAPSACTTPRSIAPVAHLELGQSACGALSEGVVCGVSTSGRPKDLAEEVS